jgi:hypothetical protein
MKIYAPVKDFNGWRNNVRFVNGVGETNDLVAIDWFRTHGYRLSGEVQPSMPPVEKCENTLEMLLEKCEELTEPDFDAMTPNELREWMRENGYGSKIKNTRNKEKLLEILRG